jgi:hypothetical protein
MASKFKLLDDRSLATIMVTSGLRCAARDAAKSVCLLHLRVRLDRVKPRACPRVKVPHQVPSLAVEARCVNNLQMRQNQKHRPLGQ